MTMRSARRSSGASSRRVFSGAPAPPRASCQRTVKPSSRASSAIRRSWPRDIGSVGRQDDDRESATGRSPTGPSAARARPASPRPGVRPLQDVQELDRALDEGEIQRRVRPGRRPSPERRGPARRPRPGSDRGRLAVAASATTPATRRSFFIGPSSRLVDLLDAVAERGLDGADVADQALQALRLDGGGLVGAPHGAVEGDVALDEGGAEGDGGERGLQAGLVAASSRSGRSGTRPAGC